MLTTVHKVINYNDIVMPEVDLANVKKLMDRLVEYDGKGEMAMDDIANLQALLPDACGGYGFESNLAYESCESNYLIAREALTSGMKVTLLAVITAAIGVILRFFKIRRKASKTGGSSTVGGGSGGANRKEADKGTSKYMLAVKEDIAKTYPVFESQLEEFRFIIDEFRSDGTLQTLDGDVYPELVSLMGSLYNHTKAFTNVPIPQFERMRDRNKMGEFLNSYAEALAIGRLQYQWIQPFNYFFLTDRELHEHTRFIEELFRYLKRNRSFETTIPDLTHSLAQLRFQPTREKDFQAPGAKECISEMFLIIENDWAPKEMAKACGLQVTSRSNFDAFLDVLGEFQKHSRALFGTDLYESGPGDDKFKAERMQAYYDFITKDSKNPLAETATAISIMVDQCFDLLKIAEGQMTKGGRVDFLSESKNFTASLKDFYDRDMSHHKPLSKFTEEEVQNLADLKEIGVFLTGLVRFTAELTRIVEYNTRFDEKLDDLDSKMTGFTKVLLQVNKLLKKVKE